MGNKINPILSKLSPIKSKLLKFPVYQNLIFSRKSAIIYIEKLRKLFKKNILLNAEQKFNGKKKEKRRKVMKLTEKSTAVFDYVKANGGRVSIEEICNALDRAPRSINANVTDLAKKGLVEREKIAADTEHGKDIVYVVMTEAGKAFVPAEDDAE